MRNFVKAFGLALSIASPFAIAAPVDINTASAEQIAAALNGVGPSKAAAIVAYRDQFGPFTSVDQLAEVSGIGPATVDKNRDQIQLEAVAPQ
ncbi:ComEA family DNA-binding protein [Marinobacterium sp. YM272]|uniref:ComEA family DNA-binding protein n=1 Tax=Marinobacterium sp. YM272 TaxID=3421654 RepID=UPI003D7FEC3F